MGDIPIKTGITVKPIEAVVDKLLRLAKRE